MMARWLLPFDVAASTDRRQQMTIGKAIINCYCIGESWLWFCVNRSRLDQTSDLIFVSVQCSVLSVLSAVVHTIGINSVCNARGHN